MEIYVALIGSAGVIGAAVVAALGQRFLNEIRPRDEKGNTNGLKAGEVLYQLHRHTQQPARVAHPEPVSGAQD